MTNYYKVNSIDIDDIQESDKVTFVLKVGECANLEQTGIALFYNNDPNLIYVNGWIIKDYHKKEFKDRIKIIKIERAIQEVPTTFGAIVVPVKLNVLDPVNYARIGSDKFPWISRYGCHSQSEIEILFKKGEHKIWEGAQNGA